MTGREVLLQLTCPLSLTPVRAKCSKVFLKCYKTTMVYVFHLYVEKMADNTIKGALKRKLEQLHAR